MREARRTGCSQEGEAEQSEGTISLCGDAWPERDACPDSGTLRRVWSKQEGAGVEKEKADLAQATRHLKMKEL